MLVIYSSRVWDRHLGVNTGWLGLGFPSVAMGPSRMFSFGGLWAFQKEKGARCSSAALLAMRLEILTYRAASRRRKLRNPPGTMLGGRGALECTQKSQTLILLAELSEPCLTQPQPPQPFPFTSRFPPGIVLELICLPLLFLLTYLSSCFLIGWLEFSIPPQSCCTPFCYHYKLFNAHLLTCQSERASAVFICA